MKHSKLIRFFSIVLVLVMLFGLVACSKKNEEEPAEEPEQVEETAEEVVEEEPKMLLPEMTEEEKEKAIDLYYEYQEEIQAFLVTLEGKSEEEQVVLIQEKLDELYEAGYLMEPATYDESEKTFTVTYRDGSPEGRVLVIPLEIPGGDEYNAPTNAAPEVATAPFDIAQTATRTNAAPGLRVLVLNGFEDNSFRTDYYVALEQEWSALGIDVTVDYDVTIADMTNLSGYDAVVFSMHGCTYNGSPLLIPDEEATRESDLAYYDYIADGLIYSVSYVDGTTGYLVTPEFFEIYGRNGLNDTFFFSETCLFYGGPDYCSVPSPDRTMANALLNAGASGVIGYFNSVLAVYSRDVMKTTLEGMFDGQTMLDAFDNAKAIHGDDDANPQSFIPATPLCDGDQSTTLVEEPEPEVPDAPEEEEEEEEEPTYEESVRLQDVIRELVITISKQLFGITPVRDANGLYCIPYTNTTRYTFTVSVTVDYYDGSTFLSSETQVLTFEPGTTVNVPFAFPEGSTTGRLSYEFLDIYIGDYQVR